MIISFFTNNVFATGVDYSTHPDLIFQGEIADDFDFSRQAVKLEGNEGNYSIKIEALPPPKENEQEKFARVFQKLVQAERLEVDKKDELLEGVEFSNKQIGDLIQARVFEDNPHSEKALSAKFNELQMRAKSSDPAVLMATDPELFTYILAKMHEVDAIRNFFTIEKINKTNKENDEE